MEKKCRMIFDLGLSARGRQNNLLFDWCRRRAAALEETGLETALTVVHLQFHVPYPESFHNSAAVPSLSLSQVNDEQAEQCLQYGFVYFSSKT